MKYLAIAFVVAAGCTTSSQPIEYPKASVVVKALSTGWIVLHDVTTRVCYAKLADEVARLRVERDSGVQRTEGEVEAELRQRLSGCIAVSQAVSKARAAIDVVLRLESHDGAGEPAYCIAVTALEEAHRAAGKEMPLPPTISNALSVAKSVSGCGGAQ